MRYTSTRQLPDGPAKWSVCFLSKTCGTPRLRVPNTLSEPLPITAPTSPAPPPRAPGRTRRTRYTFEEAVLAGWADDSGMIVPESIPAVSAFKLQQWRGRSMSYAELAFEIFSLFVTTEVP